MEKRKPLKIYESDNQPVFNLKDGKHPNPRGVNLISKNLEQKLIDLLSN